MLIIHVCYFLVSKNSQVWMSHGDTISELPNGFDVIISTKDVRVAAYKIKQETTYVYNFIQKFITLLMENKFC